MKIADIPVNLFDGVEKIYDRWPVATACGASINVSVFIMALLYEDKLFAALSLGVAIAFLWVACLAGVPKK